jgi:hypothetical protein
LGRAFAALFAGRLVLPDEVLDTDQSLLQLGEMLERLTLSRLKHSKNIGLWPKAADLGVAASLQLSGVHRTCANVGARAAPNGPDMVLCGFQVDSSLRVGIEQEQLAVGDPVSGSGAAERLV